jgi:molybdopterin-biosynthesis enzyme MoeA-like protein
VPESEVADLLRSAEKAHEGVAIGSYPFFREGRVGANFVVRATDAEVVDACVNALTGALEGAGYPVTDGGI